MRCEYYHVASLDSKTLMTLIALSYLHIAIVDGGSVQSRRRGGGQTVQFDTMFLKS